MSPMTSGRNVLRTRSLMLRMKMTRDSDLIRLDVMKLVSPNRNAKTIRRNTEPVGTPPVPA